MTRTPSSQAVTSTLLAHAYLLRLLPRLVSADRDELLWRRHLEEIGWREAEQRSMRHEA